MKIAKRITTLVVIITLMAMLLGGCVVLEHADVNGNGKLANKSNVLTNEPYKLIVDDLSFICPDLDDFEPVLIVDESLDDKITVETDSNVVEYLSIEIDEDNKKITVSGKPLEKYEITELKITLGTPIYGLELNGAFDIDVNSVSAKDVSLNLEGTVSGSLQFGQLDSCVIIADGVADLSISGSCGSCTSVINGVATIKAFDFLTKTTDVQMNAVGTYEVYATELLKATLEGVGEILYKGDPQQVQQKIDGVGSIEEA